MEPRWPSRCVADETVHHYRDVGHFAFCPHCQAPNPSPPPKAKAARLYEASSPYTPQPKAPRSPIKRQIDYIDLSHDEDTAIQVPQKGDRWRHIRPDLSQPSPGTIALQASKAKTQKEAGQYPDAFTPALSYRAQSESSIVPGTGGLAKINSKLPPNEAATTLEMHVVVTTKQRSTKKPEAWNSSGKYSLCVVFRTLIQDHR